MSIRKQFAALALTGALATGGLIAGAAPAAAAPSGAQATCPYPYACIIKNGSIIGRFRDVTSGWQNLPSRPRGPLQVVNTRNDDVVYIRYSSGSTACITPNTTWSTSSTLTGIRISSSSTC
ncbi:hypothetical protein [Streptomyces vastus]|uniref:Peptidase inhibitor n=1 Tax=Streptomyces vastus TaxID=285451 RepID=A0ABP6CX46_9ACTN